MKIERVEDDRDDADEDQDAGAEAGIAHRVAPCAWLRLLAARCGDGALQLVQRKIGHDALPAWPFWSMMILSMPPNTRSMVSRNMRSRMTSGALRYSS